MQTNFIDDFGKFSAEFFGQKDDSDLLIFVAMAEGIALYGLIISFMILGKL